MHPFALSDIYVLQLGDFLFYRAIFLTASDLSFHLCSANRIWAFTEWLWISARLPIQVTEFSVVPNMLNLFVCTLDWSEWCWLLEVDKVYSMMWVILGKQCVHVWHHKVSRNIPEFLKRHISSFTALSVKRYLGSLKLFAWFFTIPKHSNVCSCSVLAWMLRWFCVTYLIRAKLPDLSSWRVVWIQMYSSVPELWSWITGPCACRAS